MNLSDDEDDSDIKYAVVMTNISQLEQTSEEHESQIALVMICFWGISLFAQSPSYARQSQRQAPS